MPLFKQMNDLPRQKLCEIIAQHRSPLCDDARLCASLLKDRCAGQHKREIKVLMDALHAQVTAGLQMSGTGEPVEGRLKRLTKQLQDDTGLTPENARWAVESWALALKVVSPADLTNLRQPAPSPIPARPIVPGRWPSQRLAWVVIAIFAGLVCLGGAAAVLAINRRQQQVIAEARRVREAVEQNRRQAAEATRKANEAIERARQADAARQRAEAAQRQAEAAKQQAVEQAHKEREKQHPAITIVKRPDNSAGSNGVRSMANMGTDTADAVRIKERYNQWLNAWQSRNIEAYMSFYSPAIVQKRASKPSYGYGELRQNMKNMWDKQSYISIKSRPPSILLQGDSAYVKAFHDYDSSTWWDKGVKEMVWKKENGEWRIVEEAFRRQAGGPKR